MDSCINESFNRETLAFKLEIEEDHQINFLDVKLIREDDNIIFDLFKKNTSCDRYLNYILITHYLIKKE